MKKKKPEITIDKLARMTHEELAAVREEMRDLHKDVMHGVSRQGHQTKAEILEMEGRLLAALKGIEVKKPEFDILTDNVEDLTRRVNALEKRH